MRARMNAKIIFYMFFLSFTQGAFCAEDTSLDKYFKNIEEGCFILYDVNKKNTLEYNQTFCQKPMSPDSTFKIMLSLIGYDQNILKNEHMPEWKFKKKYIADYSDSTYLPPHWRENTTPQNWMRYSVVWYSQLLTKKLGLNVIQKYLNEFNYGNKDFSGDYNKNNGLTHAWLESSLKISAEEQIEFLKNILQNNNLVNHNALEMTKKNLFIDFSQDNQTSLYGKTGSGVLKSKKSHGWFVGWLEKDHQKYIFVTEVILASKDPASLEAKKINIEILSDLSLL